MGDLMKVNRILSHNIVLMWLSLIILLLVVLLSIGFSTYQAALDISSYDVLVQVQKDIIKEH